MIADLSLIIDEIKKCQSLYHYCIDTKAMYTYLKRTLYRIDSKNIIESLNLQDVSESTDIETLRCEVLKVYGFLTNVFLNTIHDYKEAVPILA